MKKSLDFFWKYVKQNKENTLFVAYLIITFVFLIFHQAHRDEIQAWLLVRDCSLSEIVDMMKYEGHFLLWYLILFPFAKLGFSYHVMNVISWVFCVLGVYLILYKAPFSFLTKVLIISSYPLLYLYSVVSRCYCLLPLFSALVCLNYKDKIKKPVPYLLCILFLFNVHVIVSAFVGILIIDYLVDLYKNWGQVDNIIKRKNIISFFLLMILMFLSLYPIFTSLNTCNEVKKIGFSLEKAIEGIIVYPLVFIHEISLAIIFNNKVYNNLFYCFGYSILVSVGLVYFYVHEKNKFFWIFPCFLFQDFINTFIYQINVFSTISLFFIFLSVYWIFKIKEGFGKQYNKFIYVFWGIFNVIAILNLILILLYTPFSNANKISDYINNNVPSNSIICVGGNESKASSVIIRINDDKNIKFYQIPSNRYFTYSVWDKKNREILSDNTIYNLKKLSGNNLYYLSYEDETNNAEFLKKFKLLLDYENKLENIGIFNLLVSTQGYTFANEDYKFYKINMEKLNEMYK